MSAAVDFRNSNFLDRIIRMRITIHIRRSAACHNIVCVDSVECGRQGLGCIHGPCYRI